MVVVVAFGCPFAFIELPNVVGFSALTACGWNCGYLASSWVALSSPVVVVVVIFGAVDCCYKPLLAWH